MSTTFTCPHCHRESDYEDIQMDADLLAIIKIQPVFGKHHNLVWAYCELFGIRPLSSRRKKLRLLLEEMKALFQTEGFFYQKKQYRIDQAGIASALNLMTHKHWESHLENHNYLKKIMIGIAETAAKTESKDAEKDLRKKEAGLMSGSRDGKQLTRRVSNSAYPVPEEHVLPPMKSIPPLHMTEAQIAENKRKTRELLKSIGG